MHTMNAKIWGRWLARLFKKGPVRVRRRNRPQQRLNMEPLEDRLTPTQYTWVGLGGSGNWNAPLNWSTSGGAAVPTNGADLAFGNLAPNAFRPTNDNLTTLTSVNSITFSGPGYTKAGALGGNAFALVGTITVDGGLGTETINNNLTLTPTTTTLQNNIGVFGASTLDLTGTIVASEPAVGPTSAVVETAKVTLTKTQ